MAVSNAQHMRFSQLDRILELEPNSRIVAERTVRAEEDFLRDHFPLFAVLPGVLMLEALFQASCWLIHRSSDFELATLMLAEAKNVKFADFVAPGQSLQIECELLKQDGPQFSLKCQGTKGEVTAVSARLVIRSVQTAYGDDREGRHDRFVASARRRQFEAMFGSIS